MKLAAQAVDRGNDAGGVLKAVREGGFGEGVTVLGQSDGADPAGGFDGESANAHFLGFFRGSNEDFLPRMGTDSTDVPN